MSSSRRSFLPRSGALLFTAGLTLATLLLRWLLPAETIELYYARGLFTWLRPLWDNSLARLPVPLFYVFWGLVAVLLVREGFRFRSVRRSYASGGKRRAAAAVGVRLTVFALLVVVAFLWAWGFNYGRVEVEDQLRFATYEPSLEELRTSVYGTEVTLSDLRGQITTDTSALSDAVFPTNWEDTVRPLVAAALRRHDYPAPGRPRAWELLPRGILLRLSTAGVYWPWAGQGNIDAGLHPLEKPAVMAHELAHAYGFGDEGTCSFWAYLAGRETTDPLLRYAMQLAYWRQLAGQLRYADPEGYLEWRRATMDPGIRNDLEAIYANGEQYRDIAPALRDATYNAYLKAQGIDEGLLNYNRVVRLVEGYRRAFIPPPE